MNKDIYINTLRRLRNAVRRKRPEKLSTKYLVYASRQCSSTPVRFGKERLSKEQCDNSGVSPYSSDLDAADF